jgi:phage shock protein C
MAQKPGPEDELMSRDYGLRAMRRIPERGVIAGVCAGVAEYFDWNVRLLRAILVIGFVFSGFFPIVVLYCALWYVMDPLGPEGYPRPFERPAAGSAPPRPATMDEVKTRFARLDQRLRNIEECVTDKEFELRQELKKLES